VDSITKIIGDFIFKYGDRPNVEIEAKFGFVIDKQSNQRIRLPSKVQNNINGIMSPYCCLMITFQQIYLSLDFSRLSDLIILVMNEACINPQVVRFESYVHLVCV